MHKQWCNDYTQTQVFTDTQIYVIPAAPNRPRQTGEEQTGYVCEVVVKMYDVDQVYRNMTVMVGVLSNTNTLYNSDI